MLIDVQRYKSNSEATLSRVTVIDSGNLLFSCYGLEDEHRDVKVRGETRIPEGLYKVGLRTTGGHHYRYSNDRRFKSIHRGMLHVLDVPGFEFILIHVGNTERDTAGCLLVGMTADENLLEVYQSAVAYRGLYATVIDAAERGELSIQYTDNDR